MEKDTYAFTETETDPQKENDMSLDVIPKLNFIKWNFKKKSTGIKQQRKCKMVEEKLFDKELLLQPLLHGWRRDVVVRQVSTNRQKDVYYFAPHGKTRKMRSFKDLEKYLSENDSPFTKDHFTFARVILGYGEPYEISREAASRVSKPELNSSKCPGNASAQKVENKKMRREVKKSLPQISSSLFTDDAVSGQHDRDIYPFKCKTSSLEENLQSDASLNKEVLYVEELSDEEKSPESTANVTLGTLSMRYENHRKLDLCEPPTKDDKKPEIPVFQLKLEDLDDEIEQRNTSAQVLDTKIKMEARASERSGENGDITNVRSKIRVRTMEELCNVNKNEISNSNVMNENSNKNLCFNFKRDCEKETSFNYTNIQCYVDHPTNSSTSTLMKPYDEQQQSNNPYSFMKKIYFPMLNQMLPKHKTYYLVNSTLNSSYCSVLSPKNRNILPSTLASTYPIILSGKESQNANSLQHQDPKERFVLQKCSLNKKKLPLYSQSTSITENVTTSIPNVDTVSSISVEDWLLMGD